MRVGDRVQFNGWHPPHIPCYLADGKATVVSFTRRGMVVVQADGDAYGTRAVWSHMLRFPKAAVS